MITTILLVGLGGLLLLVVGLMLKSGSAPKQVPAAAPAPLPVTAGAAADLRGARPGDVISVHAGAADFSDLDFTVDRRSYYQHEGYKWTDLSGEFRGDRVYLEVQASEILGLLDPRKLTLVEIGVSEEQLASMDAQQDPRNAVTFEGRRWQYESSREIGYFENEQGVGEGLYRWVFREQNGKRVLCVEKWAGEPFEVRLGQILNPQDITVFRAA